MTHKNQILLLTLIGISIISWIIIHKNDTDSSKAGNSTIIVGTNAEYPPFSFKENNSIIGFDIDLITEIVRRLGKKIIIKDMPFEALIPQMQLGSIQVIAAGMTPSAERAKQVLFTQPHLTDDPLVILSTKNNPISTIEELRNKRIVVNEGFTADYYISSLKIPHITRLASVNEGLLALQSNRAEAFVTAQSAIQSFLAINENKNFNISSIPNTQEQYAFMVSKKYPELFAEIKKTIDDMRKDDTLDQIKTKWHL